MEKSRESTTSNFVLPGILLALAATGYVANRPALETARPEDKAKWTQESKGKEDVESRLWQDPFLAADKHIRRVEEKAKTYLTINKSKQVSPDYEEDKRRHTAKWVKEKIEILISDTEAGATDKRIENDEAGARERLTILAVTVAGAPYAEQEERRRRVRYAVLAGLNGAGFVPENQEHIGYFVPEHKKPRAPQCKIVEGISNCGHVDRADENLPRLIPYEILKAGPSPGTKNPSHVLVLWIDNESFSNRPLAVVTRILSQIAPGEKNRLDKIKLILLGPSDSGSLVQLVREVGNPPREGGNELRVFTESSG